jgi:hypothetical protein
MNEKRAIEFINKNGILMVFPIKNQKLPKSLWSEFFPRKKMVWDWDEDADDNVANLWHLMKSLSDSKKVVYTKWYRGRATFFSRKAFVAALKITEGLRQEPLPAASEKIYDILLSDSPLSTKQLKKASELQGKFFASTYNRATKYLFERFYIVAFGEVDDGAFPSLCVGAACNLYEDLWQEAKSMSQNQAHKILSGHLDLFKFKTSAQK